MGGMGPIHEKIFIQILKLKLLASFMISRYEFYRICYLFVPFNHNINFQALEPYNIKRLNSTCPV